MVRKSRESEIHLVNRSEESPHPALKLRHKLRGHTGVTIRMALSPNGRILASPASNDMVQLWNLDNGEVLRPLEDSKGVLCVAWSPNGLELATGGRGGVITLWSARTGQRIRDLGEHSAIVYRVIWSPNGKMLASYAVNETVYLWDPTKRGILRSIGKMLIPQDIAWSPDSRLLCCGSAHGPQVWDVETGQLVDTLKQQPGAWCVAWSPDGQYCVSGSDDSLIMVWEPKTMVPKYVLEGHTSGVVSVSFFAAGRLLASVEENGTVILWRTDNWAEVARLTEFSRARLFYSSLFCHPTLPLMAVPSRNYDEINVWDINLTLLRGEGLATPTTWYVNAKAVLLGESGVGKSGLGMRIAEGEFRHSKGSTHAAQFWYFKTEQLTVLPENIQAELTLWDLAGQPEYRLIHQLFLDDTDAALLLFDCSDPDDPFRGVHYWTKALRRHAPAHALRFLVSARCDVSPVTVDRREINHILASYALDKYYKTSALTGEGVESLFEHLVKGIPWDQLPRTSRPQLFQAIREFLLERKEAGATLLPLDEVRRAATERFEGRIATQAEVDTVVGLLQSRGLVYRLHPRPDVTWVLLKPERVNQYGASIIQAARNHPLGIGAIAERDVLLGNLTFTGFERLPQSEEALVLEATAELLIRHDLCFREMGYLVFPSQINVTRLPSNDARPRTEVTYRFSGSIETIYASLVVRLSYTDYFRREDQWKYTVEFSRENHRLGFSMRQVEESTGELEIYFYPGISEFDRVTFIRFVTDHLRTKGIDIEEQIRLYCPECSREVTNQDAIEIRIQGGFLDIPCQFCATKILIAKSVEDRYRRYPFLSEKQQQLTEIVEKRTAEEVEQFRSHQRIYITAEDHRIHILHLSDLHIEDDALTDTYRMQLESDLIKELGVRRLEYLVVSGDIANRSHEKEYRAAFALTDNLVKGFGLDASRLVVVPGNHDLNWGLSKKAYSFVYREDLPTPLPEDRHIPAGDTGALLRDEQLYRERFAVFNDHFYRRVYTGNDYALDYADQVIWVERPDDRILFLGFNSCWDIDHYFQRRAGINMSALTRALDRLKEGTYDGWLKIAVWHHPVTGREMMNDEFVQLLVVHGFQVCLHGHVHEAIEGYHKYDDRRGIHIIGAGTFGSPAKEQVPGIPLQYNLLTFDPKAGEMTVHTRKKEKIKGAWSADPRWGDKNDPKPWYKFQVQNYQGKRWGHPIASPVKKKTRNS